MTTFTDVIFGRPWSFSFQLTSTCLSINWSPKPLNFGCLLICISPQGHITTWATC